MSGGFFELLILFLIMGYIDSGGPGGKYYSCPDYCATDHKHIKEIVMSKGSGGGPPGPPATQPSVGTPVAVHKKGKVKGYKSKVETTGKLLVPGNKGASVTKGEWQESKNVIDDSIFGNEKNKSKLEAIFNSTDKVSTDEGSKTMKVQDFFKPFKKTTPKPPDPPYESDVSDFGWGDPGDSPAESTSITPTAKSPGDTPAQSDPFNPTDLGTAGGRPGAAYQEESLEGNVFDIDPPQDSKPPEYIEGESPLGEGPASQGDPGDYPELSLPGGDPGGELGEDPGAKWEGSEAQTAELAMDDATAAGITNIIGGNTSALQSFAENKVKQLRKRNRSYSDKRDSNIKQIISKLT